MPRRRITTEIPSLGGINWSTGDITRKLAEGLRQAIRLAELRPEEQLPSTRTLAEMLGVSRGTVTEVFEQLVAEGFLEPKAGAGTRVSTSLQNDVWFSQTKREGEDSALNNAFDAAGNLARMAEVGRQFQPQPPIPFSVTVPVGAAAPDDAWRRLGNRVRATGIGAPAGYGDPQGLLELRQAISEHVRKARAVRCEPRNVVITSGTQQGLYVSANLFTNAGDQVWTEDPAYPGLIAILEGLRRDVRVVSIPVDEEGLQVDIGRNLAPRAKLAFVTPSHQFPIGMPMSMARRNALIAWAKQFHGLIIEDDFNSELRYKGHPFPSLQGLAPEHVVYLGTFSKILFPSLRLGFAVVPDSLVSAFVGARALIDRHPPTADQHVLAKFMESGNFEAHIRRIRTVYTARRAALLSAIQEILGEAVTVQPSDQGMHILVWLSEGLDDIKLSNDAAALGIVARPISPMYRGDCRKTGLLLGFGGFQEQDIRRGVEKLAAVMHARNEKLST